MKNLHTLDKYRLGESERNRYGASGDSGNGWHISDLKIYDQPRELGAFRKPEYPTGLRLEDDEIKRPPQSWCYVEVL